MRHIKCVVIGDKITEKNRFLTIYTTRSNPGEYVPSFFENYSVNMICEDQAINLQLWDTTGQEDSKKLRPLSYPQTDIFIILFSLVRPGTLNNLGNIWVPEIRKHCPDTPYIMVGVNKKMRDNYSEHEEEYKSEGLYPISTKKGNEIKERMHAIEYIECEMEDIYNVDEVFNLAIKTILHNNNLNNSKSIDEKIIKIGIYGDHFYKREMARKYSLGNYDDEILTIDEDIYKIIEFHNEICKLFFNFSENLSDSNAIVFLFDEIEVESFNEFNSMISEMKKMIPCVLVADIGRSPKESQIQFIEKVEDLIKQLNCDLMMVDITCDDDIEEVFHNVLTKIPKEAIKKKQKIKRHKNKKHHKKNVKKKLFNIVVNRTKKVV